MRYLVPYSSLRYGIGNPGDEVRAHWPWDETPWFERKTAYAARRTYDAGHRSPRQTGNSAHGGDPYPPADCSGTCT